MGIYDRDYYRNPGGNAQLKSWASTAVGTIILSHAPYLRKGLSPDLELHGTDASLSIDRLSGAVRLFRANEEPKTLATLPDTGLAPVRAPVLRPHCREPLGVGVVVAGGGGGVRGRRSPAPCRSR